MEYHKRCLVVTKLCVLIDGGPFCGFYVMLLRGTTTTTTTRSPGNWSTLEYSSCLACLVVVVVPRNGVT